MVIKYNLEKSICNPYHKILQVPEKCLKVKQKTIKVEEKNLWKNGQEITTDNSKKKKKCNGLKQIKRYQSSS